MKKKKVNREFNLTRGYILSVIKEKGPLPITKIAKEVKLSAGTTIYRYIEELEQRGLITLKKEKNKSGQPTMVTATDLAKPMPLSSFRKLEQIKEEYKKFKEKFNGS